MSLLSSRYSTFADVNRRLWSEVPGRKARNGQLLVEPQRHPVISHANAVMARIIKEARGLSIVWGDVGDPAIQDRLHSYDPDSSSIPLSLAFPELILTGMKFLRSALKLLLRGDILGFSTDGIYFGDILYDACLSKLKVATIRRVGPGVLLNLFILFGNYYRFKRALQVSGASALLVSHTVGLSSGVFMRAALRMGLDVYLRASGSPDVTLNLYTSLSDVYIRVSRPHAMDMQLLSQMGQQEIDRQFEEVKVARKLYDKDAGRAHSADKKIYRSKKEFGEHYCVADDKKYVFVMLHAFNDHPHSHSGKMIFKDYYEWFVKTLDFANKSPGVVWIFKEHPSAEYYPTNDLSLADQFSHCENHIVFLETTAQFGAESLSHIADVVVTVAGTAGIEYAANAGVPSVVAGVTLYSGFGFTIEPETEAEYFQVLANIDRIDRLNQAQRSTARKLFLFEWEYADMPFSWCPYLTYKQIKDPELDSYYWDLVSDLYSRDTGKLLAELRRFAGYVNDPEFSRLCLLRYPPSAEGN